VGDGDARRNFPIEEAMLRERRGKGRAGQRLARTRGVEREEEVGTPGVAARRR
jgi:hypothetical protein